MSTVTPRSCMVSSSENASRHLERDGVAGGVFLLLLVLSLLLSLLLLLLCCG